LDAGGTDMDAERLEDDEGSGIAQGQRWLRRRRGIDDRDESRKDALENKAFCLTPRKWGAPGDHHHHNSGLCKALSETALS